MEFLEDYLITAGDRDSETQDLESIWNFPSLDLLTTTTPVVDSQRDIVLRDFLITDGSVCGFGGPHLRQTANNGSPQNRVCEAGHPRGKISSRPHPSELDCEMECEPPPAKKPVLTPFSRIPKLTAESVWETYQKPEQIASENQLQNQVRLHKRQSDFSRQPETPPSSCDSDSSPSPIPERLLDLHPTQVSSKVTVESNSQHRETEDTFASSCSATNNGLATGKQKVSKVIIPLKEPNPLRARKSASAASGRLVQLLEEERKLLIQEGLPVPVRYPLTKADERNLKRIRRKIKNKVSAQESRRKKKEYIETLEDQIKQLETENSSLKDRLKIFDKTNKHLICELKQMKTKLDVVKTVRQVKLTLTDDLMTLAGETD